MALIVFAECGLLLGFFLPGDSLLFVAGLAVTTGLIATPLWLVCAVLVVAAFAGNVCGYYAGRAAGPAIFDKRDARLLKREYVERTQRFFDKYGNRAILLDAFPGIGLGRTHPVDGAFYLYADVANLTNDASAFCRRMLDEAGVAATPGLDFDPRRGARTLRFSYARATAEIAEGLDRLARFMAAR